MEAAASHDDEEDTNCTEGDHHDPAPDATIISNQEHTCKEKIKEAFSRYCFEEEEVSHDKVEITEGENEESAE